MPVISYKYNLTTEELSTIGNLTDKILEGFSKTSFGMFAKLNFQIFRLGNAYPKLMWLGTLHISLYFPFAGESLPEDIFVPIGNYYVLEKEMFSLLDTENLSTQIMNLVLKELP